MLRAIAELIAPPSAPPDIVCVSINNGKASATAASDFVPNLLINQTSVRTTIDWIKKAMVFGADILISNGTIGFVRNSWVLLSTNPLAYFLEDSFTSFSGVAKVAYLSFESPNNFSGDTDSNLPSLSFGSVKNPRTYPPLE